MTRLVVQCYRQNNQTQHSDGVQSRSPVDSSHTQLTTMKLVANCDRAKQSTACLQTAPNWQGRGLQEHISIFTIISKSISSNFSCLYYLLCSTFYLFIAYALVLVFELQTMLPPVLSILERVIFYQVCKCRPSIIQLRPAAGPFFWIDLIGAHLPCHSGP